MNFDFNCSFPKNKIKALLLEGIDKRACSILSTEGYDVKTSRESLTQNSLISSLKNIRILGIRSNTVIDENVIKNSNRLMTIGAFCIGTNQIDLNAAALKGIAVFNAPFSNTRSVVELTIGEMIMLMRKTFEKSKELHNGIWEKDSSGSRELKGKTLGIIGYGNIGSQVGLLSEFLGMKVCFYDIAEKLVLGNAEKCKSIGELLRKSDIVSVHTDGRKENTCLIGEKEFGLMKKGAIFLNLSRGYIVDLKALRRSLKNKKISGAAIDVFPNEPKTNGEFYSELQGLENVILTPHIGGSSIEAQRNIAEFVSNKIIDYFNTGNTSLSVNIPNIQLPEQGNAHRLLHLHKNVPGILAQINNIFAKNNINILGQYLKTNELIGYAITDVDKKYDQNVIDILRKIPYTIRFRVLY